MNFCSYSAVFSSSEESSATVSVLLESSAELVSAIKVVPSAVEISAVRSLIFERILSASSLIILNINGFYNPLLEMLQRAVEGNFMRKEHVAIWKVASTAEEAINLLYTTPVWNKEIRKFAAI